VGEWIGEMEEEEEWKGTVVVSRALGSGSSNANGGGEWAVRSRSGAVTAYATILSLPHVPREED